MYVLYFSDLLLYFFLDFSLSYSAKTVHLIDSDYTITHKWLNMSQLGVQF